MLQTSECRGSTRINLVLNMPGSLKHKPEM